MKKTDIKPRIKYYVMIAALLVSVFNILLSTTNTYAIGEQTKAACDAVGGTWTTVNSGQGGQNTTSTCVPKKRVISDLPPLDQLKSYAYYTALSTCARSGFVSGALITNQWKTQIKVADVNTPSAWLGESVISTGSIVDPSDAKQQCKTMIKPALTLWGIDSTKYESFLGSMGYNLLNKEICQTTGTYQQTCSKPNTYWTADTTGDTILNKFRNYVKTVVYDNKEPTLAGNDGLLYLRGQTHLELPNTCAATPFKKVADLTAEEKALYPNSNDGLPTTTTGTGSGATTTSANKDYLIVHLVNGTSWVKENWVYKISKAKWSNSVVLGEKPSGGASTSTCVQIARDMNGYADAIAKDAQSMILNRLGNPADKYGKYISAPGTAATAAALGGGAGSNTDPNAPTCVIDGIGWIVCPVVNFLAGLADGAFGFLANNFLRTEPTTFDTSAENKTYQAWTVMRTVANVAFVIVFLIIIFSQLTSMGVSSYGVKKMLPRLIIAAILVNLSYFVSQIAVDLSNILGYSVKEVFDGINNSVSGNSAQQLLDSQTGDGFAGIAGIVLAGAVTGVAFYALLSTLIPVILAAVVALIMILFILIARQAIIILLVVISPLAFVAYLLPNTESLFTKWRKTLTTMLLLFPIIALVFGVSTLASGILASAFTGSLSGDDTNLFGQIAAAAVLVLPLFVVPTLLKKSLDGIPALGQMANKLATRANGNFGRKLGDSYKGGIIGRGAAYRKQGEAAYRNRKFAERVTKGGVARILASGIPATPTMRAGNESLVKSAVAENLKAQTEEVNAAKAVIENANLSGDERQTLAMKGTITVKDKEGRSQTYGGGVMQKAAIQEQLRTGSMGNIHDLVNQSHLADDKRDAGSLFEYRQTIAQGIASNGIGARDPSLAGKQLDMITQGTFNQDTAISESITDGKYTAEAFVSMHNKAREEAIRVATNSDNPQLIATLKAAAAGIRASPEISAKLSGNDEGTKQIDTLLGLSGGLALKGDPRLDIKH
jgi:hypothetical protein